MVIIRPKRWTEKPPLGAVEANPDIFGDAKRAGLWLLNDGTRAPFNLVKLRGNYGGATFTDGGSAVFPAWGVGAAGPHLAHGNVNTATQLVQDATTLVPTQGVTIALGLEKRDATLRAGGAFGVTGSTIVGRSCGAHIPFTDGSVYWQFGGVTEDTSQETAAGLTTSGYHTWGFTTGPRGMEIWQDGLLRSSNAANPTRTAPATPFALNGHRALGGDVVNHYWFMIYEGQLPQAMVRDILLAPYGVLVKPQAPSRTFFIPKLTALSIAPSGIASAEAFGTAVVIGAIAPTGIASAEAFGTPSVAASSVAPSSIASAEAFGTPLVAAVGIGPVGIASAEAFGAALILLTASPASLRTACGNAIMIDPCPIDVPTP